VLFVNGSTDETVLLSARNVPYADTANANNLNVYNLMLAENVILTRSAVAQIGELFASTPAPAAAEA
jgi:ribosomal protein L4